MITTKPSKEAAFSFRKFDNQEFLNADSDQPG